MEQGGGKGGRRGKKGELLALAAALPWVLRGSKALTHLEDERSQTYEE